MKGCPVCYHTWNDEIRLCLAVTDKTRKVCGAKL